MVPDQYQVLISLRGCTVLSRRDFVGRLAAGAGVACAAGIGRAEAISAHNELQTSGATGWEGQVGQPTTVETAQDNVPGPWELLSPLSAGAAVGHGWRVTELSAVSHGSCVLTLENGRGRVQRVHVCGNSGSPQGLVFTNQLDLVVMNGGAGDLPTDESFAQALAEVAHVLASNEGQLRTVLDGLQPHAQRVSQYVGAAQLR